MGDEPVLLKFRAVGRARIAFAGFPHERTKHLIRAARGIPLETTPLDHQVLPASLFPLSARAGGVFVGGVRSDDDAPAPYAQVRRHDLGQVVSPPGAEVASPSAPAIREAVFGGVLFGGYGHVLLESLNRLWYASERPDLDILFAGLPGHGDSAAWRLLKTLADLLGVDPGRLKLIVDPVRVARLHVPQPGLELGLRTSLPYVDFFRAALRAKVADTPGRERVAYVSRSRLKGAVRRAYGETALDEAFAASGDAVYWPETLTLEEQVRAFNAHAAYVGLIGSHLHNLMLRYADGPVDCAYLCSEAPNLNFLQIDMLFEGQRLYCACARYEPVFEFGNRAPFRIALDDAVHALRAIDIHIPPPTTAPTDDATFVEEWGYLLFHYKVFRPLELRSTTHTLQKAGQEFRAAIMGLIDRLVRRQADLDALRPALLEAYDRAAAAHRSADQDVVRTGRALLENARN